MYPIYELTPTNENTQYINLTKVISISVYESDVYDNSVYVSILFETMPDSQLFLMSSKEEAIKEVTAIKESLRDMFYARWY